MTSLPAHAPPAKQAVPVLGLLLCATAAVALASFMLGPVGIGPAQIGQALMSVIADVPVDPAVETIVLHVRLPRVVLAIAVGAALALSGCALQGILRNPLADPGLIGVTSGAAVGAVATIVFGSLVAGAFPAWLRAYTLPVAAFAGAGLVTAFVFRVARGEGVTSVATLILAGVAVNAIANAAIGALIFVSTDQQLRELTFWTLGGLGAAGWLEIALALVAIVAACVVLWKLHGALDLLQLGERAAFHAGLPVESVKRQAAVATALAVGAATAVAGPIVFIGLVAPHLARLITGPSHRSVMPAAAVLGAGLVLAADLLVRTIVPPTEPPIGLATSLIGGPVFLWLLLARSRREAVRA
ncbi:MAG: FecCD family ABC transporter permease [Alphaproteobacteria bacterium]